jgi:hypothetical protein
VARIVEDLPERDRRALLEALPGLLKKGAAPAAKEASPAQAPPPPPSVFHVPPAAEALPAGPYLLACGADVAASAPEEGLRAGDWLLVDATVGARADDLVVLRGEAGALVRRVVRDGDVYHLRGATAAGAHWADPLDEKELRARLAQVGLGTVLEVRRLLRRPES